METDAEGSEGVDRIDALLRGDPARAFGRMDAGSREDYRDRVHAWAVRSRRADEDIARVVLSLAKAACDPLGPDDRRAHVGYYLTDAGIVDLAAALQVRPDWRERLRVRTSDGLLLAYCGLAYSLCALYGVLSVRWLDIHLPWPGQALLALAVAVYVGGIIPGWFNMILHRSLVPRRMPRLDFASGIPDSAKTLVVIPCLLTSQAGIERLARTLERLRARNAEAGAGYAMLSDFVDADAEHADGDAALLDAARAQIDALNARHGGGFALLHRPRRWNPAEGRWIGWERKRGKLEELNAFLAGEASPFATMHGDLGVVDGARYVLTLDDDNADLTPGAIRQLAGALAHPLNRPVLDDTGRRVAAGYVIMLPRARISLPGDDTPSRLETLFHTTVEIETSRGQDDEKPTVDVDQDVFGQSCYVGKGMYDAHLFHHLTRGLIAENTILSHDILEGALVRAAVVSDVILDETFVPTFYAAARRTHRWQRGDWQLIPWLLPWIRDASGRRVKNTLSLFGRWKLFQNIMRVMFPIAALVCFVTGWATSGRPGAWTLNLLAIAWIPALVGLSIGAIVMLLSGDVRSMLRGLWASLSMRAATFIFAVDHARNALDAIVRASYRMWVSHRKRLEWTASILVSTQQGLTFLQYLRLLWFSPVFAVAVVALVARVNPAALWSAAPFALLWCMAPFVAWWWSQPMEASRTPAGSPRT